MCKNDALIQRFTWKPLLEVGKGQAYDQISTGGGTYCIKTESAHDPELAKQAYLESDYMQTLKKLEIAATKFYDLLSLPSAWVAKEGSGLAEGRLERLRRIPVTEGACSILYFGSIKNLQHRMGSTAIWRTHGELSGLGLAQ